MKSLADMMGAVLKETGSAAAMTPLWARVVGEVVAKHTRPVRWEGKALVIRCDAEAWRQALEPERAAITRKLIASLDSARDERSPGHKEALSIVLEVSSS